MDIDIYEWLAVYAEILGQTVLWIKIQIFPGKD